MYSISRLLVWLARTRHCRGFGVQSPSDYSFIRYVVNEHYPYYAYSDIEREMPSLDDRTRKLGCLYFRIANFLQPSVVVDHAPSTPAYSRYMQAGCRKAVISDDIHNADHIDLLRMTLSGDYAKTVDEAMGKATGSSVFVLEGIKRDRGTKAFWRKVRKDGRVGVTFDLYYAGVLFFDTSRYKQNYIVNF